MRLDSGVGWMMRQSKAFADLGDTEWVTGNPTYSTLLYSSPVRGIRASEPRPPSGCRSGQEPQPGLYRESGFGSGSTTYLTPSKFTRTTVVGSENRWPAG